MRRAMFRGSGRITIEDAEQPKPGPGELLVRVHACALCGSDRGALENGSEVTPGHETAGVVVEAGPETRVHVGSRGAVFLVVYCGECGLCRAGSRGACLHKEAMLGFTRDGGFAEYVVVPERCFLPVDPRLSLDEAVMLLDVVGTSMHALRRAHVLDEPPVVSLVMGAGPVGLGCVLALKAIGVPEVFAIDVAPFRLDFARRLGATPIIGGDSAVETLRELVPEGVPLVIEASGHPMGQRQALDLTGPGGKLVTVGHSRVPLEVSVSRDLIQQEKTILGSEYFDDREHEDNQRLLLDGKLPAADVITHRLPLEDIEEAYRLFLGGETGKVLIYPRGEGQGCRD